MIRKFRCKKEFELEIYDVYGNSTEEYITIQKGEVFELNNDVNYIGGENHLEKEDLSWIEISFETLEEYFEEVKTLEKINVKDITPHSKNDKERKPRIIELKVCEIAFRVHRYIHIPGTWFLSCYEFNIEKEDMKTDDLKKSHTQRKNVHGRIFRCYCYSIEKCK